MLMISAIPSTPASDIAIRKAISIANENSTKLNLFNRAKFFKKSVEDVFYKKFDLVVSNPPYIERKSIKS